MNVKVRNIEVDVETAERLEARAAARGMSVSELLTEIASGEDPASAYVGGIGAIDNNPWSPVAFEEDARRLAEFDRTRMGVPWDEIKSWMETWGTATEHAPPIPHKL
jgi:Ribbon-helix-helix protein, copG family